MPGSQVVGPCVEVNRLVRHDLDSPHSAGASATSFSTGELHSAPTRPAAQIVQHITRWAYDISCASTVQDRLAGSQRQAPATKRPTSAPARKLASSSMLQRQHLIACRHVTASNPTHAQWHVTQEACVAPAVPTAPSRT